MSTKRIPTTNGLWIRHYTITPGVYGAAVEHRNGQVIDTTDPHPFREAAITAAHDLAAKVAR